MTSAPGPSLTACCPRGHLRRLIAQQFQVSGQNDFALLARIGGECAGAITFFAPSEIPSARDMDDILWLDDGQLIAILDELPHRPMLVGKDGLRLSLAGAQDKLPVVFDGQRIGLPQGGQPSTHVLKPAIHAVEDSVTNEGFCLALAHALKLPAAQARIHAVGERRFLLVARFDRQADARGGVMRLHQEDFCQALGVVPEMKYPTEGGPDLAACFNLSRRVARPSAPQVLRLLDYVVFNALIGNHDAHAKNFALLYNGKSPSLAPLYDTLATAVCPTLTPTMAMKLGSKYRFSEVEIRHWQQFTTDAGLARAQTRKRILELARTVPAAARELQSRPDFVGYSLIKRIVDLIEQRAALTIRRLNEPEGGEGD